AIHARSPQAWPRAFACWLPGGLGGATFTAAPGPPTAGIFGHEHLRDHRALELDRLAAGMSPRDLRDARDRPHGGGQCFAGRRTGAYSGRVSARPVARDGPE